MNSALVEYIDDRLATLREELEEAKGYGVNTPGFNQTLGALDELKLALDFVSDPDRIEARDNLHRTLLGIRAAAQSNALEPSAIIDQISEALGYFRQT